MPIRAERGGGRGGEPLNGLGLCAPGSHTPFPPGFHEHVLDILNPFWFFERNLCRESAPITTLVSPPSEISLCDHQKTEKIL